MKMWLNLLLISIFGCSNILTTDLGGVISGNRMAGVPLGRSMGDGEVDVEGVCTESGVTCQNCTHTVTCIPLPIGWLKIPLEECQKDQSCNTYRGGCSNEPVPECEGASRNYQHTCEQIGIFPDAFDCRKFHLCSPPEGIPSGSAADHREALCPRNYGYNPSNAQCSVKLPKGQCTEKPVPGCKKVGDYGVLPSSPNHYYVCFSKRGVLYPQIFICPHGWFFWADFCRPEPQIPERSTEAPTTEAGTTTTEKITTETYSILKALFATDKPTTQKPDTFLADRYPEIFDLDQPIFPEQFSAETAAEAEGDMLFNSWENT